MTYFLRTSSRASLAATVSLALAGCAVLPDVPRPTALASSTSSTGGNSSNMIGLEEVIVIGHSPFEENGGSGGHYNSGGGGFSTGGGGTQGSTPMDNSGGGGGGGGYTPPVFDENTDLSELPAQLGDYSKTIRMKNGPYSDIETRIEIDQSSHKILKISSVLSGVTKFRALTQVGDGVQLGYEAATDRYLFNFAVQITYADGSVSNGIKDVYGWISPRSGTAGMKFD